MEFMNLNCRKQFGLRDVMMPLTLAADSVKW